MNPTAPSASPSDPVPGSYRELNPAEILATADTLGRRITERFPDSGLARVCAELRQVASECIETSQWLARPHFLLRFGVGGLIAILVLGVAAGLSRVRVRFDTPGAAEFLQALESGVNDIAFLAIAIFFLSGWEARRKRSRALKSLHLLRSLAHIIDMHQLTKDPERVTGPGRDTDSSPVRRMSPFELTRYLDYCSEMLSLLSKLAALHVQHFDDTPTLAAVKEIEDLTNGLSRKIWQKIMILDRVASP